jgi:nuclear pore complex protein Nup54
MGMKGQQMMNNGGAKASFKALWNAAWTGPHRADGISHEIFIQRAIQDHMTGPQGDYGFITQKLWEQALTTTVINGMKVFPHPIVGFNQLKSRIQNQRERAKKLSTQADRLKELARTNRATLISTKMKIETERKKQLELRQKTIAVMKLVERLHHWNQPTRKNDILFRERINGLNAELSLPHRFRGQLDELRSQMSNQQQSNSPGNNGGPLHLSAIEKERVFDFLTQQQRGLAQLTEIVRKDVRDLAIMRSRSIMEIKQAQKDPRW